MLKNLIHGISTLLYYSEQAEQPIKHSNEEKIASTPLDYPNPYFSINFHFLYDLDKIFDKPQEIHFPYKKPQETDEVKRINDSYRELKDKSLKILNSYYEIIKIEEIEQKTYPIFYTKNEYKFYVELNDSVKKSFFSEIGRNMTCSELNAYEINKKYHLYLQTNNFQEYLDNLEIHTKTYFKFVDKELSSRKRELFPCQKSSFLIGTHNTSKQECSEDADYLIRILNFQKNILETIQKHLELHSDYIILTHHNLFKIRIKFSIITSIYNSIKLLYERIKKVKEKSMQNDAELFKELVHDFRRKSSHLQIFLKDRISRIDQILNSLYFTYINIIKKGLLNISNEDNIVQLYEELKK